MFRSTYLLVILLAISFISSSQQQFAPPYGANAQFYNNNNYQNLYAPNRIQLSRQILPNGVTYYTLGHRIPGDRLVGQTNRSLPPYNQLQDVQQKVWYPDGGIGKIVTFVEIWVQPTSPVNNAYLTEGGINQRFISILIEAKQTRVFSYRAAIYAY